MMPNLLSSVLALPTSDLSMLMTLAQGTIILVAAIVITVTMRRASAGARHLVWLVTLGTLLLVPALTAWGPLRLAILPPTRVAASPATSHVATPSLPTAVTSSPELNATPKTIASNQTPATDDGTTVLSRIEGLKGFSAVIAIWAAIVVLIAGWLMYGTL